MFLNAILAPLSADNVLRLGRSDASYPIERIDFTLLQFKLG